MSHDSEPNLPPVDEVATQPPPEMRNLRIVAVPTIGPKLEPDTTAVLVVSRDGFMGIVNELAGSGLGNMRRISQKLQESIRHEAMGEFALMLQAEYSAGYVAGYEAGYALGLVEHAVAEDDGSEDRIVLTDEGRAAMDGLGSALDGDDD